MTTNVRIVPDSGDELILSLLALSRRLEDPEQGADVLTALVQRRRASVTLKGGLRATVTYADTPIALSERPRLLRSPQSAAGDYVIQAGLYFEIPATIHIGGMRSAEEAIERVSEVLKGQEPPPKRFGVHFDGADVEDFHQSLEIANEGAPLPPVRGLRIHSIDEQMLLGVDEP